jgi:hypothetical protein
VRTAAAEIDVLLDHTRVAAVAPHPERVADDRDGGQPWRSGRARQRLSLVRWLRLRRRIVVDEIAPELDARAKHPEKVGRGAADANLLGLGASVRERRATRGNEPGHVLEELG